MTSSIKTYVLRRGKMNTGVKNAYVSLAPIFCLSYPCLPLDFAAIFGNTNPVVIEIGFGMGGATAAIAKEHPLTNYIGLEVHTPGVAKLLSLIKEEDLQNIRIIEHDALEVINDVVKDGSVFGFHIFFPDPWPKKRHHKRRLMQKCNIDILAKKLVKSGYIAFATDWEDYAQSALAELTSVDLLKNEYKDFAPRGERPITKFEQRAIDEGRKVWDIRFTRV